MRRGAIAALALLLLVPALSLAAPSSQERRVHPRELSGLPSYVRRVEPSIVGLRVRAPENAPSSPPLPPPAPPGAAGRPPAGGGGAAAGGGGGGGGGRPRTLRPPRGSGAGASAAPL